MKQVLQNLTNGETIVEDVPRPSTKGGHLLIETRVSLISAGTERMLVDFGKSSYVQKAKQQPEKVIQVLDKVRTDGFFTTYEAVKCKLDQPLPMGYSNVGRIAEVGTKVDGFKVGDRVLSNGPHAEVVCVPQNLCAKIPDNVSDEDASFTVVGAIALQGIRLAQPTLGETFVVTGLGLIGLIAVQILRANGCRVLGIDFDADKLALARSYGAETVDLSKGEDPIAKAEVLTEGRGVDGVIITASTKSNDPVHQGATMCRKRGRIILVGVVGLELQRNDFYEKELSFQVSCSYGPGRYDPLYEDMGQDYPLGHVRWTEQRNFEAILELIARGALQFDALKSKTFSLVDAPKAYTFLLEDKGALGVVLTHGIGENISTRTISINTASLPVATAKASIGIIGAGNYAGRTLIPAFKKTGARLRSIASSQGRTGTHYGKKYGFELNTTDTASLFTDEAINTIIITTQHDSHAHFVIEALNAGKNVFVEKPLALNHEELDRIEKAYHAAYQAGHSPRLMVGFNRRFAPMIKKIATAIKQDTPLSLVYTCNAGQIPADHWTQDMGKGGGRIIGEACHFIDLARGLIKSPIINTFTNFMTAPKGTADTRDVASISLAFENGSIATVHYFANGHRSYPKERLEVFQNGAIMTMDNFLKLNCYGVKGLAKQRHWRQDKGQEACAQAFVDAINHGKLAPISFEDIMEVARTSIDASSAS